MGFKMSNSSLSKTDKNIEIDFEDIHGVEKLKLGIDTTESSTGLALSGGGIRSASFGLGVIQAFLEHGIMQKIDYLSTVSGGGYIGASLSWYRYLHSDPVDFFDETNPFGEKGKGVRSSLELSAVKKNDNNKNNDNRNNFLSYIRQHGNFLNPTRSLNLASAIGVALRNLVISLMIYFSLLLVAISLWTLATNFTAKTINKAFDIKAVVSKLEKNASLKNESVFSFSKKATNGPKENNEIKWMYHSFFYINLSIASIIFLLSITYGLIFSLSTFSAPLKDAKKGASSYTKRNLFQWISGILLYGFIVFLLLALVPLFNQLLTHWMETIGIGIVGVISGMWAALSKFRKFLGGESFFKKASWIGDRLFEIGALIFLYFMVVFSYNLCLKLGIPITIEHSINVFSLILLAVITILALILAYFVNINYASLGRMYRDRLMEAFLPGDKSVKKNIWAYATNADEALLKDMCKENDTVIRKPYHLINTNVILTNSKEEKYRRRGGDSFLLSPLFCGSDATGFVETECFLKKNKHDKMGMSLSTAMAVSGAAANPHTGVAGKGPTRGPLVSILMTIFNLRLGSWISNPKDGAPYRRMNYIMPGLCSLLCVGHAENSRYLELTDGGHFENLGLYELVRRRVGTIIVADAGVDKDFKFGDLANAIEKVRTDFGVSIRFEPEDDVLNNLFPGSASNGKLTDLYKLATQGYVKGKIKYPQKNNSPAFKGRIFLLKTTMTKNLPADLYSYKAQNNDFPDQPTSDQFFDEKQFEAYRELGYRLADSMCIQCKSLI